jgi:hypothetical protein
MPIALRTAPFVGRNVSIEFLDIDFKQSLHHAKSAADSSVTGASDDVEGLNRRDIDSTLDRRDFLIAETNRSENSFEWG